MRFPNAGPRASGLSWNVSIVGDSNSDTATGVANGFTGWWLQLAALAAGSRFTIKTETYATGGWKWEDAQAIASTINAAATAPRDCVLVMLGTNNLDNNESASSVLTKAATFLAAMTNYQKRGLIWVLPQSANSTRNAQVDAFNAGAASVANCDFVVSRAGVTALSNSLDTTYFYDSLHINGVGGASLASITYSALQANL